MHIERPDRTEYIDKAPIGTLVAFNDGTKTRSAKIIKRNKDKKRLLVKTAYKKQYILDYSDIIWVKLNNRWPSGVYRALKGVEVSNAKSE